MSSDLKGGGTKVVWLGERFPSRIRPALVPSEADFSWLALQTDEYSIPYIYRVFAVFACRSKGA